jgi:hypothetical protein
VAQFKFKGAVYDLVESEDLDFQEISDMEEFTSFDATRGKGMPGLVWISVRRQWPNTTWDDIKGAKLGDLEMVEDEEDRLPPTSNGAAAPSTVDAQTEHLDLIDSGSLG